MSTKVYDLSGKKRAEIRARVKPQPKPQLNLRVETDVLAGLRQWSEDEGVPLASMAAALLATAYDAVVEGFEVQLEVEAADGGVGRQTIRVHLPF